MNEHDCLPRGCRIIELKERVDQRGKLSFAEAQREIPFDIERVFWIYDVPEGKERGSHAHNECAEVVVPVQGEFDMVVDDGTTQATLHMDSPHRGVLIPAGVWCSLRNFAPGTICVVMASHPYNAAGYIHDYETYKEQVVEAIRYDASRKEEWDEFVRTSRNGTFLLERGYMDYHADRFVDCSLMFYKKERLIAVVPANHVDEEQTVYSHGGLTYGGILLAEKTTTVDTMQVMSYAMKWYHTVLGAKQWIYKPIPHIYHRCPAEEDLYALFRQNATLKGRAVSSAIKNPERIPIHRSRNSGAHKAQGHQVHYEECTDLRLFWPILDEVLMTRHHKGPVHSIEEMELLQSRFPKNIRLFIAKHNNVAVAGTLVYEMEHLVHTQYIASSEQGRAVGALDGLLKYLIEEVYAGKQYFDFGVSTEQGGSYLNEGLIFQKEGFGARAVMYDTYLIKLTVEN